MYYDTLVGERILLDGCMYYDNNLKKNSIINGWPSTTIKSWRIDSGEEYLEFGTQYWVKVSELIEKGRIKSIIEYEIY